MPPLQRARHIASRLRSIAAFGRTGLNTRDKLKMLVVGYARGHNFGATGVISRVGRTFFPEIAVRSSLLGGLVLHIDPSDLSHLVVADEIFREQVYNLNLVPFMPDVIMDCGAHIGMFTLLAARKFPKAKLVAFEPDPENCRWLCRQIEENRLSVEIVEAAVSTFDGEAVFEAGGGCGSMLIEKPASQSKTITVNTIDLGRYLRTLLPKRLLFKLDVEGAEEKLLPSVIDVLPQDCVVFLETHRGDESWGRLSAILRDHSFAVSLTRRRDVYTDGVAVRTSTERR